MRSKKYFPVIIFSYNRPDHLRNLLNCIKINKNYRKYKYFFFCDGPRDKKNKSEVLNIEKCIKEIKKFPAKKNIFRRKKNLGLARNIINGVSKILSKNKAAIILEDDLIISDCCIDFINFCLNKFIRNKRVGSISGYSYIHNLKEYNKLDWFKLYRHCSWSWGTWSHVWNRVDWIETNKIHKIEKVLQKSKVLEKAGTDIPSLIRAQSLKFINSWAIRFNFFCLIKNLYSISPRYSQTKNEGFGVNATHTFNIFKKQKVKFIKNNVNYDKISLPKFNEDINNIIKDMHKPSIKLKLKLLLFNKS